MKIQIIIFNCFLVLIFLIGSCLAEPSKPESKKVIIDITGYVDEVIRVEANQDDFIKCLIKKASPDGLWGSKSGVYVIRITHPVSVDSGENNASSVRYIALDASTTVADLKEGNKILLYVPPKRFTGK